MYIAFFDLYEVTNWIFHQLPNKYHSLVEITSDESGIILVSDDIFLFSPLILVEVLLSSLTGIFFIKDV